MAYSAGWLIENEIILLQYRGLITVDELSRSISAARDMIESSPQALVHLIGDVGEISQHLSLLETIRSVRALGLHPRAGWNITLREKTTLKKMGVYLAQPLHRIRTRSFETLYEALDHMKEFDEPVTWANVNSYVVASLPLPVRSRHPAGGW